MPTAYCLYNFFIPLPVRRKGQPAPVAAGMLKANTQTLIHCVIREMLEPFHDADAVHEKIVREIQLLDFAAPFYPVEVNVIEREPAVIFIDQSERGAANPRLFADLESLRHSPHEAGLAASQLSGKPRSEEHTSEL